MRGRHGQEFGFPLGFGFTPAHAGKTGCCMDDVLVAKVHPRTCGEDTKEMA